MNVAVWSSSQKRSRRGEPFTVPEVDRIVQEVRQRKNIIHGTNKQPPKLQKVRKAWEEISKIITKLSGIERTGNQCRKRYNDMKRRGQMPPPRKRGRPPKIKPCEIHTHTSNNEETAVDDVIELGYQAPLEDEPSPLEDEPSPLEDQPSPLEDEPSPEKQKPVLIVEPKEPEQPPPSNPLPVNPPTSSPPPSNRRATSQPRIRNFAAPHERHQTLEIQKGGFEMLQRELSRCQQNIVGLNSRLNQIEVLLRPIGHIADSLARIATAVERLTSPPTQF